jgi:hypothetical protein
MTYESMISKTPVLKTLDSLQTPNIVFPSVGILKPGLEAAYQCSGLG